MKYWPIWAATALAFAAAIIGWATGVALDQANSANQWLLATRYTARVGVFFLLAAYVARPLAQLYPARWTKALLSRRKYWGLGFAASHTVHLACIITFFRVSGETYPLPTLIGGGLGYVLLYAMALTSNRMAMQMGKWWKRLHRLGIHYLWFIFAFSYFGRLSDPERIHIGAPLFALTLLAAAIRLAAWIKMRRGKMAGLFRSGSEAGH